MSGDEGTAGDEGYGMSGDGGKAKRRVAAAMVLGAMETRRTRMFVMAGGSFLIALACLNMLASFKKTRTTLLKSKMDPYVSSKAARSDLSNYFDHLPVHKSKRMGISARRARMQLNNIFKQDPVAMHHARALSQRVRKQVVQDLAFSSKNAKDDIDSYFDSMQPETHKYSHHHEQHEAGGHEATSHVELQHNLAQYKEQNPEFAKKLDEVHAMWMKDHKTPPRTAQEKREYGKLVTKYVGDMQAVLTGKEQSTKAVQPNLKSKAFKVYMDQHPDVKKKFMKVQTDFIQKYGHMPKTEGEKKTFKSLIKHYVGHLEISVKKTLGKDSAAVKPSADDSAASKVDEAAKSKMLKVMEQKDPMLSQKLQKAHDVWIKAGHKGPPRNQEEEKEYRKLLDQMVGNERTKAVKSM